MIPEFETREERMFRIRALAMRNHAFEGEGQYCETWITSRSRGGAHGTLIFKEECGYTRDLHPEQLADASSA